jgi:phosphoribosyl-AMP cyclohydrolase
MADAVRPSNLDPKIAARLKRDANGLVAAVARVKGESSGHQQWVRSVALDCDGDAVLVKVDQVGAACHTGDRTCFDADVLDAALGLRPAVADD